MSDEAKENCLFESQLLILIYNIKNTNATNRSFMVVELFRTLTETERRPTVPFLMQALLVVPKTVNTSTYLY